MHACGVEASASTTFRPHGSVFLRFCRSPTRTRRSPLGTSAALNNGCPAERALGAARPPGGVLLSGMGTDDDVDNSLADYVAPQHCHARDWSDGVACLCASEQKDGATSIVIFLIYARSPTRIAVCRLRHFEPTQCTCGTISNIFTRLVFSDECESHTTAQVSTTLDAASRVVVEVNVAPDSYMAHYDSSDVACVVPARQSRPAARVTPQQVTPRGRPCCLTLLSQCASTFNILAHAAAILASHAHSRSLPFTVPPARHARQSTSAVPD